MQDSPELLRRLLDAEFEFVVVGDVAAGALTVQLFGHACRIVSLDDLIAVKAHVGRPKHKQVELELRAIRARLQSG